MLKGNPSFGEVERIDMKEIVTMWKYMEVDSDDFGIKKGNRTDENWPDYHGYAVIGNRRADCDS